MIKKIQRYIDTLSYQKTMHIIFIISIISSFLLGIIITLFFGSIMFKLDVLAFWGFSILFSMFFPLPLISCLKDLFGTKSKFLKEATQKLNNLVIDSNNSLELVIKDFEEEYYPVDLIIFYLNQKGTRFWLELEKNEKTGETKNKICITDNDNPDQKIEYHDISTSYVTSHFEFKN